MGSITKIRIRMTLYSEASSFIPMKLLIFAAAAMPMIPFKARLVWFTEAIASDGDVRLMSASANSRTRHLDKITHWEPGLIEN